MSIHLSRDLETLQRNLLSMCEIASEMVHQGVAALGHPDPEFSKKLAREDDQVDRWDVLIEDACLKTLALHQPVAVDLRQIATVLKITGELERVADLGVNIAERAAALAAYPPIAISDTLKEMSRRSLDMLDRAIAAYVQRDSKLARDVCAEDDEIDELNREIIDELTAFMQHSPDMIQPAMHLFSASRHVERVADHATNIAEDVIYLVEGEIVRHRDELHERRRESA